jgi:hypothetical protein
MSAVETPSLGPNSYEAYLQAERTYPANNIPLRIQRRAKATFSRIARADLKRMKQVKAGHGFLWAHSNGHGSCTARGRTASSRASRRSRARPTSPPVV